MGNKKKDFRVDLQIAYVDVTDDELPAFRAGLALILDLFREERAIRAQRMKVLEDAQEREKDTPPETKRAWLVVKNGSARQVPLGSISK